MITLETMTQILNDLWVYHSQDGKLEEFVEVHDIGIPLAALITLGHATATPSGLGWIEEDYLALCDELGVDKYGDYDSLETMLEISEYPDAEG